MENQYSVLLYSKYSQNSNRFIKMIDESNIDFAKITGLTTVCIDNDDIRKRILNSKNILIANVPCVLKIFGDGGVEKYEGEDAFKWAEEIIVNSRSVNQLQPVQPQMYSQLQQPLIQNQIPHQMQQPQLQQPLIQQSQIPLQMQQTQLQQPLMQQPQIPPQMQQPQLQQPLMQQPQTQQPQMQQPQIPPQMQHQMPPQMQAQMQAKIQSQQKLMRTKPGKARQTQVEDEEDNELNNVTSIEDIESDEDENHENIEREDIFPPKHASLRSGAGSYEVNTSFGEKKNETKIKRGIKSNEQGSKKNSKLSVMEAAMAMQKTREKETEASPRPVFA